METLLHGSTELIPASSRLSLTATRRPQTHCRPTPPPCCRPCLPRTDTASWPTPPYRASVDFYRVEYAPADRSILKKTIYTATFVFMFKDQVPNQLIPFNPLGLTITYFREDQAFTNEVRP